MGNELRFQAKAQPSGDLGLGTLKLDPNGGATRHN